MGKVILDKQGTTFLLLMLMLAKVFTPELRMLPTEVGPSAWLVTLLAGLVALGGLWFLIRLLARFPGQSLVAISKAALGRFAGSLVVFAYFLYFLLVTGMRLREFTAGFHIAVMPRTPISIFILMLLGVALFATYKGAETLTRMAAYLLPLLFVLMMAIVLGTFRHYDYRQLFPFFGLGLRPTLLMVLPQSSAYGEILALGVLASMIRPQQIGRIGLTVMLGTIAGLTWAWLMIVLTFPYPGVTHLFFPMLDLARLVEVSEFLQRVESIFVFLWFFMAAFKISAALLCTTLLYSELAGLADYRPLLFPIGLITYATAFYSHDVVSAISDAIIIRTSAWPVTIGLPILTLLVAAVRRKRGDTGADAPDAAS